MPAEKKFETTRPVIRYIPVRHIFHFRVSVSSWQNQDQQPGVAFS